jgi:hypothetical protein
MQISSAFFLRSQISTIARRSLRNQPTTTRTKDLNSFIISITTAIQESCLDYGYWAPPWFSMIVCGLADTEYRPLRTDETLEVAPIQYNPLEDYVVTGAKEIKLYTDGPKIGESMGSACLFLGNGQDSIEIKCRPSQTNPSADKAELFV